ncbi:PREDICTED: cyclin-dependent protein kinase inhibitor SMR3 [Camelina sativa]|uniref:Cyclin-dependent protein kinase inhibitor SMR3 n=2 Tax=Camelina sativa TaxID=90675 RepID=A0ABM0X2G2_CAMSA|nr:PREDICTED: cyclin-dependent protein kinase inhibitor SMR3 [Camelina sativa]
MASKGKKPIRRTTTRRSKRIHYKNPSPPPCSTIINSDVTSTSSSPTTSPTSTATPSSFQPESGCCTPKSKKSRIPEMLTCPPAPKKQKVGQNCALRRRQIAFFASPDVEMFFVFALGQQINK